MAGRTLAEVNAALVSVRTAISAAETAQDYTTGLSQRKRMAELQTLYDSENALIAERNGLETSGTAAGPAKNYGVRQR